MQQKQKKNTFSGAGPPFSQLYLMPDVCVCVCVIEYVCICIY
jgi:hypothetical protein